MREALTFGPPVISVDVEDWPQSTWDRSLPITDRAAVNTRRVLELLDEADVPATMFVLGKFAEKFPDIVKEIQAAGHEVACHGYGHVEIFKQSRDEFAADVRRSKDILEQITGRPVTGYRAPDFSIVRHTLWALDVLAEMGFEYDSSIFPIQGARYGIPDWPTAPVRVRIADGADIVEAPTATMPYFGKNWPIGGGGYHRLLPGVLSRYLAGKAMAAKPFVYYCHPYEIDAAEFSEIAIDLPWHVRLHQGVGRRWFAQRLKNFLGRFGGQRMIDLVSARTWPNVILTEQSGRFTIGDTMSVA
jgi:polysaccharide deacetylase family protein (PEP-CTERM system associated)